MDELSNIEQRYNNEETFAILFNGVNYVFSKELDFTLHDSEVAIKELEFFFETYVVGCLQDLGNSDFEPT